MSSKAATYCYHGVSDNEGLLLLCETQCGKEPMYKLEKSEVRINVLFLSSTNHDYDFFFLVRS